MFLWTIGGSIGAKRRDGNHVLIGIGLSKFNTKAGLSSLDESFSKYFIQLARSFGYVVTNVNEFYTSQKCPRCHNFIRSITFTHLHCVKCRKRYHRDAMSASNMCNIIRNYLNENGRLRYLQPVDSNGSFPWEDRTGSGEGMSDAGGTRYSSKTVPSRNKQRASSIVEANTKKTDVVSNTPAIKSATMAMRVKKSRLTDDDRNQSPNTATPIKSC